MNSEQTPNSKLQTSNSKRWLLVLSRFAFICNVCFLVAVSLRYSNWLHDPDFISTVLIIGWVFVFIFNPVVNVFYLIFFVLRNKILKTIPVWLITANIFFLLIQLIFILFLNKPDFSE